jgi:transcriptional regulator with XRE-family HTH domain
MLPETVTQAIALVNPQAPTATDERANVPGMASKHVSPSEPATTVVARRLRKLLDFLKIDNAEFATRTRLQPSYIGRLLNGERGASGDIPKLTLGTLTAFGIDGHYWSSPVDLDPAKCQIRRPTEHQNSAASEGDMGKMMGRQEFGPGAAARAELAAWAARQGDSGDVIREIMLVEPPADASAVWWLRTYFEIKEKNGAK